MNDLPLLRPSQRAHLYLLRQLRPGNPWLLNE